MEKTIIVIGQARSGTSMAGGFLQTLGVQMSGADNKSPQNPKGSFEDPKFIGITTKVTSAKKANTPIEDIKKEFEPLFIQNINEKNQLHGLWGFKSALSHESLEFIIPNIRNPHFVVTFRNVYRNAMSWKIHVKERYKTEVTIHQALSKVSKGIWDVCEALEKHQNIPCHFTTYEEMRFDPVGQGRRMAQFIGLPYPEEIEAKIKDFIVMGYSTVK